MRSTLSKILIFATGAAIGSVVTWKLVSDRYEATIQEEIQAIRDLYANDDDDTDSEEGSDESDEEDDTEKEEYEDIVNQNGYVQNSDEEYEDVETKPRYVQYSEKKEEKKEGDEDMHNEPYVIDQDDWDDTDYEQEEVYCFADGVIANEMDEEIENAEELVGPHAAQWLEESGQDWVYIRNDRLETDFVVLRDIRRYSEVE